MVSLSYVCLLVFQKNKLCILYVPRATVNDKGYVGEKPHSSLSFIIIYVGKAFMCSFSFNKNKNNFAYILVPKMAFVN